MVVPGAPWAGALTHQSRQRRQGVDGRIDPPSVNLLREHHLAFGDVAREIRDRVGDVTSRHRENGDHRDRAGNAAHPTATLVQRREVAIEVSRIRTAPRDLAPSCRNLAKGFRVARHIRHDDKNVSAVLESEILRDRERDSRGQEAFYDRVVRGIEKHDEFSGRKSCLEHCADCGGIGMS